MRLMRRLGVELSSSDSSEGSIGPGYENGVVLPWLLVKCLWQRSPHSLFPDFLRLLLCILVLPDTHRIIVSRRLSVAVTDSWFLSFILCTSG
jgi:hypothetical protein